MRTLFFVLPLVAGGSIVAGLLVGAYPISASQLVQSVFAPTPGVVHDVIWELRAPRAFSAFACGGLLAAAGALLQVQLRNALADPYLLGVSSGAAVGALLALLLGAGVVAVNSAALAGAVAAIAVVFGLGFRAGDRNPYRMLLTGVVLATGLSALVSLLIVMAPQAQVKGMLFWLMGDLSDARDPSVAWIVLVAVSVFGVTQGVKLDLLSLGYTKAATMGVAVAPLQIAVFCAAAVATVAAVMLGGAIGFIGLMVPHAVRLMGIAAHRALLPLAILLGGALLTFADIVARTLWAPQQLPVGILTALMGVPAMLLLLGRGR